MQPALWKFMENGQEASDKRIVNVSTIFGAAMTLGSFVVAPLLEHIDGIFSFQQHVMLGESTCHGWYHGKGTAMTWQWRGDDQAIALQKNGNGKTFIELMSIIYGIYELCSQ